MRRFWIFSAAFIAAVAFTTASVWAQARGGGQQAGGGFGAGGFGASTMGGGGLSGGGLTGGGLGGSRTGVGGGLGTGARGGTSGMFGNRNTGTGVSRLQSGFRAGGATGQGRFAGMGLADPTQGFTVGDRRQGLVGAGDMQNFIGGLASGMAMSGMQGGGRGGFAQQGRGGRGTQQQAGQGRNARGRQQRTVRTVLDIGFNMPPRNQSALATTVAQRLAQSRGVEAMSPVTVTMNGRVAVLQGVVPTDHARNVAEQLALLEPGVSRVQNELTVATESSDSTESASATAIPPTAASRPAAAPPAAAAPPPASSTAQPPAPPAASAAAAPSR